MASAASSGAATTAVPLWKHDAAWNCPRIPRSRASSCSSAYPEPGTIRPSTAAPASPASASAARDASHRSDARSRAARRS